MRETVRVSNKKSPGKGRCFLSSGFFAPFLGAVKRTMKNKNDVEISWQQNHENYLNAAIGFYELSMLDE